MEAKNLRLENAIMDNGVETHVDIDVLDRHQNNPAYSGIEPIKLNEAYLIRLGFDYILNYGFAIGQFHIVNKLGKWAFPIGDKLVWIYHVHQLQNLFFALTGTELEFKTDVSTCG